MRCTAKRKIEIGRDQLAAKEMDIGRANQREEEFHRRDQPLQDRRDAISDHPSCRGGAAAADRVLHGARHREEAQTAAAVLGHNFPDSPWYQDAYNLVKNGGFEPKEKEDSWITKAFKKVGLGLSRSRRHLTESVRISQSAGKPDVPACSSPSHLDDVAIHDVSAGRTPIGQCGSSFHAHHGFRSATSF